MANFPSRRKFVTGVVLPMIGASTGWIRPAAAQSAISLNEKSARRQAIDEQLLSTAEDKSTQSYGIDDFVKADYDKTPVGKFLNVDKLLLRWAKPDWFEYLPDAKDQFAFVCSTGETIAPGKMFTDGGSIPRWFWVNKNLSPWVYVPAYLVHDWEFDQHRLKTSQKSFEEVRDTIAEGIKTMMELGLGPRSEQAFRSIYAGVSSFVAKKYWDN